MFCGAARPAMAELRHWREIGGLKSGVLCAQTARVGRSIDRNEVKFDQVAALCDQPIDVPARGKSP
jgi:hypothetical protein